MEERGGERRGGSGDKRKGEREMRGEGNSEGKVREWEERRGMQERKGK